jgi:hypothetical protein
MNDRPIYHITHMQNLPSILAAGRLWSDAQRVELSLDTVNIGYSHIKERRRRRRAATATGGMLGDYVPFNFCKRSVMLYVIHRDSVDGYDGGQEPVVHLVSSVGRAIQSGRPWAFTDRHAELAYAKYFESIADEGEVDWSVMTFRYWAESDETKEKRQAEFLLHDWCPFDVFQEIGVMSQEVADQVTAMLQNTGFSPRVTVQRSWYY